MAGDKWGRAWPCGRGAGGRTHLITGDPPKPLIDPRPQASPATGVPPVCDRRAFRVAHTHSAIRPRCCAGTAVSNRPEECGGSTRGRSPLSLSRRYASTRRQRRVSTGRGRRDGLRARSWRGSPIGILLQERGCPARRCGRRARCGRGAPREGAPGAPARSWTRATAQHRNLQNGGASRAPTGPPLARAGIAARAGTPEGGGGSAGSAKSEVLMMSACHLCVRGRRHQQLLTRASAAAGCRQAAADADRGISGGACHTLSEQESQSRSAGTPAHVPDTQPSGGLYLPAPRGPGCRDRRCFQAKPAMAKNTAIGCC
jgi:hypothetical protein